MFLTYIVASKRNGTLYIGHTNDMCRRAEEHRLGVFPGFSQKYNCVHLVWYDQHPTREAAFIRERRIKKWEREWKLKMIEDLNPLWLDLGLCPMWPLPNKELYSQIWEAAVATAIPR